MIREYSKQHRTTREGATWKGVCSLPASLNRWEAQTGLAYYPQGPSYKSQVETLKSDEHEGKSKDTI
jgi:hypothetical protein